MTWEPQGEGSSPPAHCGTFFQREIPSDWHNLVQGDVVPGNGHPPVRIQEETEGRKQSEDGGTWPPLRSTVEASGCSARVSSLGPGAVLRPLCTWCPAETDGSSRLNLPYLGEPRFVRKPRA